MSSTPIPDCPNMSAYGGSTEGGNARYYNGKIGRFISQDPIFLAVGDYGTLKSKAGMDLQSYLSDPQSFNSYAYARNNPLAYIDETGEFILPLMQEKTGFIVFPTMGEMKADLRNGWNNILAFRESVGQWEEDHPTLYNFILNIASTKGGKVPKLNSGRMSNNLLPEPIHGRLGNIIPRMNRVSLPNYAQESLSQYEANGFNNRLPGYQGGRIFQNQPGYLPAKEPNYYREWDVKPIQPGVNRGAERFVTGKNGEVYWTNTHYGDNPIGAPFFKIK